jgi:uncharacterized membrane protein YphA (DoxX/SURF4 family)
MKTLKITYWTSTSLVALLMSFSVYAYLAMPAIDQTFHHLGYPSYFRVELAIAKLLGVIALLLPVPPRIKEWTYAGFTIVFISAFIAHTVAGDPVSARISPFVSLLLLIISYLTYHKLQMQEKHRTEKKDILSQKAQSLIRQ